VSVPSAFPVVPFVVEPGIEPYWEAAAEGRLVLSHCTVDGAAIWPPRPFCPRHMTADVKWVQATGRGVVHSFTVVQRGEGAFATAAPYVLAYVELEEGPRVLSNVVGPGGAPDLGPEVGLDIGLSVVARFDSLAEGAPILRFALAP
jgi:uncharacterized protein